MTSFKCSMFFLLIMAFAHVTRSQPMGNRQGPPNRGAPNINARGQGPAMGNMNRMGGSNQGNGPNGRNGPGRNDMGPRNGPGPPRPMGLPPGPLDREGPHGRKPPGGGPPFPHKGLPQQGPPFSPKGPQLHHKGQPGNGQGAIAQSQLHNKGRLNNNQKGLPDFNGDYQNYTGHDDSEEKYFPANEMSIESNGASDEDYFPHDLENDKIQVFADEKQKVGARHRPEEGKAEILDLNPPLEEELYNDLLKAENRKPESNLRIEHKDSQYGQGSKEFHIINDGNKQIEGSGRNSDESQLSQGQHQKTLAEEVGPSENSHHGISKNENEEIHQYHDYNPKKDAKGYNQDYYYDNQPNPQTYSGQQSFSSDAQSGDNSGYNNAIYDTGGTHVQSYSAETQLNTGSKVVHRAKVFEEEEEAEGDVQDSFSNPRYSCSLFSLVFCQVFIIVIGRLNKMLLFYPCIS